MKKRVVQLLLRMDRSPQGEQPYPRSGISPINPAPNSSVGLCYGMRSTVHFPVAGAFFLEALNLAVSDSHRNLDKKRRPGMLSSSA